MSKPKNKAAKMYGQQPQAPATVRVEVPDFVPEGYIVASGMVNTFARVGRGVVELRAEGNVNVIFYFTPEVALQLVNQIREDAVTVKRGRHVK